jgi:hypothetical protein
MAGEGRSGRESGNNPVASPSIIQAAFIAGIALLYGDRKDLSMRALAIVSVLALACSATAALAQPAGKGTCLRTIDIDHTKTPDDRTILFTMKNGAVYQSTLPTACPQLSFNGFSYVATPPEQICGNLQTIRVIRSGSVCLLGPFVQITPAKAANP